MNMHIQGLLNKGNLPTINQLKSDEKNLQFDSLSFDDCLTIGNLIVDEIKALGKVAIVRIKYLDIIVFSHLMHEKRKDNNIWLNRKENTVLKLKHASIYGLIQHDKYGYLDGQEDYALFGGGFPIWINDKIQGIISVSGLEHYEDHNVIIEALKKFKEIIK